MSKLWDNWWIAGIGGSRDRYVGRLGTNVGHQHNHHDEENRSSRDLQDKTHRTDFYVLRLDNTK